MEKSPVALGSDHAGFDYKEKSKVLLQGLGWSSEDFGTTSTTSCDYPLIGRQVAAAVAAGRFRWGLLFCGTGVGMSIVANRYRGVRAALCFNQEMARAARDHNDANILAVPQRVISWAQAELIIRAFFSTEFSAAERHQRRIRLIDENTSS